MIRVLSGAALAVCLGGAAAAQSLEADFSTQQIAITSGYVGEELIVFGARDGGGEIIIVVRGPDTAGTIHRKERIAGLWLNRAEAKFNGVPGLYAAAASQPLLDLVDEKFLKDYQIGVNYLYFDSLSASTEASGFAEALIRNRQELGLYSAGLVPVTFVGGSLFRAEFQLPAAAPVGTYKATVYLVRDGEVAALSTSTLVVTKTGLGRAVYDYSRQQPTLYGILAVLMALVAGWVAAAVFRRY